MEGMTARIIRVLRKAAGNARCAEDANEANTLADELETPPVAPPVDINTLDAIESVDVGEQAMAPAKKSKKP